MAPGGRFVLGITEDIPADLWALGLAAMDEALSDYNSQYRRGGSDA